MGEHKTMKQKVEEKLNSGNPGIIGDPTSLKAESSDRVPTEEEEGAKRDSGHQSLKQIAQKTNPTMLGDPVSLKAEKVDSEPTEQDRGALGSKKRESKM